MRLMALLVIQTAKVLSLLAHWLFRLGHWVQMWESIRKAPAIFLANEDSVIAGFNLVDLQWVTDTDNSIMEHMTLIHREKNRT